MKRKNKILIIGIIFIIFGAIFICNEFIPDKIEKTKEEKALKEFYEKQEVQNFAENEGNENNNNINNETKKEIQKDYIATIKIPKIKLEKGIVDKKSKYNNIEYGIQILEESDMPDVENGDFILASHSGNSNVSHFKDLDKVELDDIIEIRYQQKTYIYKVVNIYEIDKIGEIRIEKNENKKTLTLVTCKENTDKQIVVMCDLI